MREQAFVDYWDAPVCVQPNPCLHFAIEAWCRRWFLKNQSDHGVKGQTVSEDPRSLRKLIHAQGLLYLRLIGRYAKHYQVS